MNDARETVAKLIGARAEELVFTGSGTEANNTALLSVLSAAKRGGRVITTAIEHPSVLETVKRLEQAGLTVVRLLPGKDGIVPLQAVEAAVTPDTVLVSMMLVNNETGAIQPVAKAAAAVKRVAPHALFHCDAVQAFGKMPVRVHSLQIDLLSASAHKIHGPKGIGLLYVRKGLALHPLLTGGGQERGLRSGTEAVPLILGFAGAVKALPDPAKTQAHDAALSAYTREVLGAIPGAVFNSAESALPAICNVSLPGYRSETLLHFLENRGVYISSGSACAKGGGSRVLTAMGLPPERVDSALRISFSRMNTKEDLDLLCSALREAIVSIRKAKG